ncbi:MAG TPA: lactonase family protein [Verrucomicrobiae bacterium]|jgi:6-phosphogluconolactonase|nr:lactonase family protein [Verrucomicrobiae bacterium]
MIFKIFGVACGILFAMLSMRAIAADPAPADAAPKNATLVYVGTFTGTPAKSKGIYYFWLRAEDAGNSQNAQLKPLGVAAETPSPSFLALDPKRRLLFCANETDTFNGKPGGGVSAFSIDPATGKLKPINQQSSMGAGPCHLVLDKTGKNLLVANYGSGNVAVLPVAANGRIGEATCVVQDEGKGPNSRRQQGPHAHCAVLSPDNRFAFVCDLGIDKVMIFKFDAERGQLTPNDPPFALVAPGVGPRHIVFHPNGKFAYVINELGSSVSAFAYDARAGTLKELQTLSSLPANYEGSSTAAEIAIAPSGEFLYASNRGHDTVAVLAVDPKKGTLSWITEQKSGGKTPRHFGLDPSGKYLAICNQDSNTLLTCHVDAANGHLTASDVFAEAPSPVCAVFLP